MAELYRQKVTGLAQALAHPETRTEAAEAIRGLIDAIVLTPADGALEAHVVRRVVESSPRRAARRAALKSNCGGISRPCFRPPKTQRGRRKPTTSNCK